MTTWLNKAIPKLIPLSCIVALTDAEEEFLLDEIDKEFLEEAFTSFEDFDEYIKTHHYGFLIQGKRLRMKDAVEELYRTYKEKTNK